MATSPEVKRDVLDALQETIFAIEKKQYSDLHMISDHVLHSIVVYQDPELVDLSVAIYSLDKILEKEKYANHPKVKAFVKNILGMFKDAKNSVQKNDHDEYADLLKQVLKCIQDFSKSIKFYIDDLLHFAKIKKGTKLYEHGLSLGRASELVGVAKWDLMPAIGETAIHEQQMASKEINRRRAAFVEKIFRKKAK